MRGHGKNHTIHFAIRARMPTCEAICLAIATYMSARMGVRIGMVTFMITERRYAMGMATCTTRFMDTCMATCDS